MAGPFDNPLGLSSLTLPLREQRLQVLASNLANSDTPNFKARDFDFAGALADAERTESEPMAGGRRAHVSHAAMGSTERYLELRAGVQPSLDGNTVDAETENATFARAALEYRASLTFFESRVRGLMTAITGQ